MDKALPILNEIIEEDHTEYRAYSMRGFCHLKSENYESSLKDFELLISLFPQSK
jgi:cytochrome c-type biogenesis protein CcmH/NrfG